jgi:hypothetical protein
MNMVLKRNLFTVLLLVVSTVAYGDGTGKGPDILKMAREGYLGMGPDAARMAHGGYVVGGYAWNMYGTGEWSQTFRVRATGSGQVSGTVTTKLTEYATPDTAEFYWEMTSAIDCFEYDETTGEAWLGGILTHSNVPDIIPIGMRVVEYAKDGGPGGTNDAHGSTNSIWYGTSDNCHDRPAPLYADPVERGNIVIRGPGDKWGHEEEGHEEEGHEEGGREDDDNDDED